MKKVLIKWLDCTSKLGWGSPDNAVAVRPSECVTDGYLIREDDTCYVVSMTVSEDSDHLDAQAIPKSSLIYVKEYDA